MHSLSLCSASPFRLCLTPQAVAHSLSIPAIYSTELDAHGYDRTTPSWCLSPTLMMVCSLRSFPFDLWEQDLCNLALVYCRINVLARRVMSFWEWDQRAPTLTDCSRDWKCIRPLLCIHNSLFCTPPVSLLTVTHSKYNGWWWNSAITHKNPTGNWASKSCSCRGWFSFESEASFRDVEHLKYATDSALHKHNHKRL